MAGKGFNPDETPPPFDPDKAPKASSGFDPDADPPKPGMFDTGGPVNTAIDSAANFFGSYPDFAATAAGVVGAVTGEKDLPNYDGMRKFAEDQYNKETSENPKSWVAGAIPRLYTEGAGISKLAGPAMLQAPTRLGKLANATTVNTAYQLASDPGARGRDESTLQPMARLHNAFNLMTPVQVATGYATGGLLSKFFNTGEAAKAATAADEAANNAALQNAGASPKDFELALDRPDAHDVTQRLGSEARQLMRNSGKMLPDATDIHGEANKSLERVGHGIGSLTERAKFNENNVDVNALMQEQADKLPTPDTKDVNGEWLSTYEKLKGYFGRLGQRGEPLDDPHAIWMGSSAPQAGSPEGWARVPTFKPQVPGDPSAATSPYMGPPGEPVRPNLPQGYPQGGQAPSGMRTIQTPATADTRPRIGGIDTTQGILDDLSESMDWGKLREDMPSGQKAIAGAYGDVRSTQNNMIDDALGGNSGIHELNQRYHDLKRLKEMARWKTAQKASQPPAGVNGVPLTKWQLPAWASKASKSFLPAMRVNYNDKLQRVFEASPELAKKYVPMLQKAFEKSPELGSSFVYSLLNRPDIKDQLDEQPDRSRDKIVSHDEAKDAYQEGLGGKPADDEEPQ